jgi:hypothetical protein
MASLGINELRTSYIPLSAKTKSDTFLDNLVKAKLAAKVGSFHVRSSFSQSLPVYVLHRSNLRSGSALIQTLFHKIEILFF